MDNKVQHKPLLDQATVNNLFTYENGNLYWAIKPAWNVHVGDVAGSFDGEYCSVYVDNVKYKLHRIIFLYHHGYLPEIVDHINGNKEDNRIENLRPATSMQNRHNSKTPITNKSGVKGVCYDKYLNKWRVRITVNGVRNNFGNFEKIEDAIKTASDAYSLLHKNFKYVGHAE